MMFDGGKGCGEKWGEDHLYHRGNGHAVLPRLRPGCLVGARAAGARPGGPGCSAILAAAAG